MNGREPAFRELSDENKLAVIEAILSKKAERLVDNAWVDVTIDTIHMNTAYRIKRPRLNIPWNVIQRRFKYATKLTTSQGPVVAVFSERPYFVDKAACWEALPGSHWEIIQCLDIDLTEIDVKYSLTRRPG